MSQGVFAEIGELIALKRFASKGHLQYTSKSLLGGQHLSKIRGRGMDFSEVRNYQAGDEIRHMEWRVTARTGRPFVKLYQEERERPVLLLCDFNPSMFFGTRVAFKSVIAARLAALIAWTTTQMGDKIGGFLFSSSNHNELIPKARDQGAFLMLSALSHYTKTLSERSEKKQRPLSEALLKVQRVIKPGSILVIISDFYQFDKNCEKYLSQIKSHTDILSYHICDQLELNAPKPALYAISNGVEEMLLDTTDPKLKQSYQDYCESRIRQLKTGLLSLKIPYHQVHVDSELPKLVRETFLRRNNG